MAKKTKAPATKKPKSILNAKSHEFLEKYINNIAPTGFETPGQHMWLDYIRPYIDTHIVDTYGTVVGVINPDAKLYFSSLKNMAAKLTGALCCNIVPD